jgi:hypothetical protein
MDIQQSIVRILIPDIVWAAAAALLTAALWSLCGVVGCLRADKEGCWASSFRGLTPSDVGKFLGFFVSLGAEYVSTFSMCPQLNTLVLYRPFKEDLLIRIVLGPQMD